MNWNIEILRIEGEALKKIHAFKLYKELGIEIIEQDFPKLKSFILTNATKSAEDFETEQLQLLEERLSEFA